MSTLIITRGLPACGKTTYAKAWVAEDPANRARVNRDDFRSMMHDGVFIKGETERAVIAARDAAIRRLLQTGVDVINDDTNLPARVARDLRRIAATTNSNFEVVDMTDVDLETCLNREGARGHKVGFDVIRDMHNRFIKGKSYPLELPDEPETAVARPYLPDTTKPSAIIVDIDGTVALMGNRSPYDETRVHEDRPNTFVIEAVRAMQRAGHEVIFTSARTKACYDSTLDWLAYHIAVPFIGPFMREEGDMRKDAIVKTEIFDTYIRDDFNVVAVFDDRNQVVEMWRAMGLTVFQVADGNF